MKKNFNFNELVKFGNFSKKEEKKLSNLYNKIEKPLIFKIDRNIECAKFNYVKNEISIKSLNDYNSLIHELLHAELIFFYKFPTIKEINEILIEYNQQRLKKLFVTLTNDIHHFIFFNKFKDATKHLKNNYLIYNQKKILENNLPYDYLEKKYSQQVTYFNKILFYYESIFIINIYKKLLIPNFTYCQKLIKLDSELYNIFNNFFISILELKNETNINTYNINIFKIYKLLIIKIKNIQNRKI